MDASVHMSQVDPRIIDRITQNLKSQGVFDQFRKECLSDVDTKPAYQNLRRRVEGCVSTFLNENEWHPGLNKNQLREGLRKHVLESGFLDTGVDRIVDQVTKPKIYTQFLPKVEEVVYSYLGLEKPVRETDPTTEDSVATSTTATSAITSTPFELINDEKDEVDSEIIVDEIVPERVEEKVDEVPQREEEKAENDESDDEKEINDFLADLDPITPSPEKFGSDSEASCHLPNEDHSDAESEEESPEFEQITSPPMPINDDANHATDHTEPDTIDKKNDSTENQTDILEDVSADDTTTSDSRLVIATESKHGNDGYVSPWESDDEVEKRTWEIVRKRQKFLEKRATSRSSKSSDDYDSLNIENSSSPKRESVLDLERKSDLEEIIKEADEICDNEKEECTTKNKNDGTDDVTLMETDETIDKAPNDEESNENQTEHGVKVESCEMECQDKQKESSKNVDNIVDSIVRDIPCDTVDLKESVMKENIDNKVDIVDKVDIEVKPEKQLQKQLEDMKIEEMKSFKELNLEVPKIEQVDKIEPVKVEEITEAKKIDEVEAVQKVKVKEMKEQVNEENITIKEDKDRSRSESRHHKRTHSSESRQHRKSTDDKKRSHHRHEKSHSKHRGSNKDLSIQVSEEITSSDPEKSNSSTKKKLSKSKQCNEKDVQSPSDKKSDGDGPNQGGSDGAKKSKSHSSRSTSKDCKSITHGKSGSHSSSKGKSHSSSSTEKKMESKPYSESMTTTGPDSPKTSLGKNDKGVKPSPKSAEPSQRKPRIAANIHEVRKLMKIRREEKARNKVEEELNKTDKTVSPKLPLKQQCAFLQDVEEQTIKAIEETKKKKKVQADTSQSPKEAETSESKEEVVVSPNAESQISEKSPKQKSSKKHVPSVVNKSKSSQLEKEVKDNLTMDVSDVPVQSQVSLPLSQEIKPCMMRDKRATTAEEVDKEKIFASKSGNSSLKDVRTLSKESNEEKARFKQVNTYKPIKKVILIPSEPVDPESQKIVPISIPERKPKKVVLTKQRKISGSVSPKQEKDYFRTSPKEQSVSSRTSLDKRRSPSSQKEGKFSSPSSPTESKVSSSSSPKEGNISSPSSPKESEVSLPFSRNGGNVIFPSSSQDKSTTPALKSDKKIKSLKIETKAGIKRVCRDSPSSPSTSLPVQENITTCRFPKKVKSITIKSKGGLKNVTRNVSSSLTSQSNTSSPASPVQEKIVSTAVEKKVQPLKIDKAGLRAVTRNSTKTENIIPFVPAITSQKPKMTLPAYKSEKRENRRPMKPSTPVQPSVQNQGQGRRRKDTVTVQVPDEQPPLRFYDPEEPNPKVTYILDQIEFDACSVTSVATADLSDFEDDIIVEDIFLTDTAKEDLEKIGIKCIISERKPATSTNEGGRCSKDSSPTQHRKSVTSTAPLLPKTNLPTPRGRPRKYPKQIETATKLDLKVSHPVTKVPPPVTKISPPIAKVSPPITKVTPPLAKVTQPSPPVRKVSLPVSVPSTSLNNSETKMELRRNRKGNTKYPSEDFTMETEVESPVTPPVVADINSGSDSDEVVMVNIPPAEFLCDDWNTIDMLTSGSSESKRKRSQRGVDESAQDSKHYKENREEDFPSTPNQRTRTVRFSDESPSGGARGQRYDSKDLYKPKNFLNNVPRQRRGLAGAETEQNDTSNHTLPSAGRKRSLKSMSYEVPPKAKRLRHINDI